MRRIALYSPQKMRRIYIYQQKDWPAFTWNADVLMPTLDHIRHLQGHLLGRMKGLGFGLGKEANHDKSFATRPLRAGL